MMISRETMRRARVLVVGDSMLDRYWFGAVERISPEAPVPVVRIEREEERLGGAANVALNVRTLGAQATLLSMAGDDEAAQRLEELLRASGVASKLERDPALQTIVKLRVIGRAQQLLRMDFERTPPPRMFDQLQRDFEAALDGHDVVVFSDYGKGCLGRIEPLIALARAAGRPSLVDPKGLDYRRYTGATALTPNRHELQDVIGRWPDDAALEAGAQALRERLQVGSLVLTRSEEGISLFDAAGALHVPALAREVFDVTGAGDTVIATLAASLAAGTALRDALPLANRAGGIVVGRFGTAGVGYDELLGPDGA